MIDLSTIKILIVDDSKVIVESIKNTFIKNGVNVENIQTASSAIEALDILRTNKFNPELITMDITMPEMDGIEATEIISKEFEDIDIIMVTTKGEEQSLIKAMSAGAKGYFLKPVTDEQIEEMINYLNMIKGII
jgi:two-component system chemotaxis response regulator CheY